MPYVMLGSFHPVLITRRVGLADPDAVGAMLAWVDDHLARTDRPLALVYDAGAEAEGRPDAKARRLGGEWFKQRRKELARACAGIDFAFPSALSRGALTAVFWIAEPPMPYAIHGDVEAAIAQAIARVRLQGSLDARTVLDAFDRGSTPIA